MEKSRKKKEWLGQRTVELKEDTFKFVRSSQLSFLLPELLSIFSRTFVKCFQNFCQMFPELLQKQKNETKKINSNH